MSEVLARVRRAKTEAKLSQRSPVDRLQVAGPADFLSAISLGEDDLRAAGGIATLRPDRVGRRRVGRSGPGRAHHVAPTLAAMRWWTRRAPAFAALVVVALATGPAALAQAPGTDVPVRSRPVDDDHRAPDLDRSDHHRDHDHRAARHGWRGGHDQRARQGRTGLDDHQQPAPLDHVDHHDHHDDPGHRLGHVDHRARLQPRLAQHQPAVGPEAAAGLR